MSLSYRLDATTHVAIIGAGWVGASCAFALLSKGTAGRVTLTDMDEQKCQGQVLDLEDGGGKIEVATMEEAGRADVIIITAGRAQKPGETRMDLVKANAGIMREIIEKMKPIKETAKIIVVSNPCDALTFVAQECAGLPPGQVFGSGTVLDSWRLRVALSKKVRVHHSSITLYVLGEHGDSQFPVPSLANIGGVPFMKASLPEPIDLEQMSRDSAGKAYDIIAKKGHTAFGVAQAVEIIVDVILNNKKKVLPVSIRVPGRACCLSLPSVVGIHGVERVLDNVVDYFDEKEKERYNNSLVRMEEAIASIQPIAEWDPIPPNTPYTP